MAKQVRSLLNIEDISLDPRIGIAMQLAAKDRKNKYHFSFKESRVLENQKLVGGNFSMNW